MSFFRNIKYVNYTKISNLISSELSYFIKKRIKANYKKIPLPYSLAIEPTNFCNLQCPECPSGTNALTRERGYMSFPVFKKIIDEQRDNLISLTLHFQGEPLLNDELGKFINYAQINKIYTVFSTNAQLLEKHYSKICEAGLQKLIISLDGLTPETYNKYRKNADISKVFSALEKINGIKKRPIIEIQFLVFSHNEHEIGKLKELKSKYNIDKIKIKSAQIYDSPELIPNNPKYSRYMLKDGKPQIRSKLKNSCRRMFSSAVITWDGNLVPCCFDKNAKYVMGNINEKTFKQIWNSKKYSEFRDKIFSDRKSVDICNNCTENLKKCSWSI